MQDFTVKEQEKEERIKVADGMREEQRRTQAQQ